MIVGEALLEISIKQIRQDYTLTKSIYFLGARDDMSNLMAGTDLMLMPSLHEGFPVQWCCWKVKQLV
ncbi:glycosyltransferase [Acinetobacter zhairhuonensis]|uniref:glycosyltransferase n=1 Tax=Acinetobacter sp. A7.4 TaxID=2919921 RepID=UPI0039A55B3A